MNYIDTIYIRRQCFASVQPHTCIPCWCWPPSFTDNDRSGKPDGSHARKIVF